MNLAQIQIGATHSIPTATRQLIVLSSMTIGESLVVASMPGKDYPPSSVAKWIKECETLGRKDLGAAIMKQWNTTVDKYPAVRVNWAAATKIGANSIKKNVFGHMEFSEWLSEQASVPADKKKELENIPEQNFGTGIQVPTDNETPEQWANEAEKTAAMLKEAEHGFSTAREFIDLYLKVQVEDLKRKLADYGKGGAKSLTKTGTPSKLSERLPKWEAQLQAYEAKISELEANIGATIIKFEGAKKNYEHAPVTTVAYEKTAQKSLEATLKVIMNMEDLEEQAKMLQKFQAMVEKQTKVAASVQTEVVAFFDIFEKFFNYIANAASKAFAWAKNLMGSVEKFDQIATHLGRK